MAERDTPDRLSAPGSVMDFGTADQVVDRLGEVLQSKRRIGGSYLALE